MSTRQKNDERGKNENIVTSVNLHRSDLKSVSFRAILTCIPFLVILGVIVEYGDFAGKMPSIPVDTVPSVGAMAPILLLLVVNTILVRTNPKLKFSQAELVCIYVMLMLGGLMMERGLVQLQIINIMAIPMYSMSNRSFYVPILERLWDFTTPKSRTAIAGFWQGGADGVPWAEWIGLILFWTSIFTLFFFLMICMATLVRKRWTDYEHLLYPLNSPVINMTKIEDADEGTPGFWRNRLVFFGALWPIVAGVVNIIHGITPTVPAFPWVIDLAVYLTEEPWSAAAFWPGWYITFQPLIIGIGYLLPAQLSLSIWFFYLLGKVYVIILSSLGLFGYRGLPLQIEMARGGYLGLAVVFVWAARTQIKELILVAIGRVTDIDDSNEPLSFKVAFWGGLAGITVIVIALQLFIGMSAWVTLMYILLVYSISLSFARVRAEAGIPRSNADPTFLSPTISKTLGFDILGAHNTTVQAYFGPFDMGMFGAGTAIILEAYKFADMVRIKRRSMTKALLLAFVVAVIFGYVISLPLIYEYGMFNMNVYRPDAGARATMFNWAASSVTSPIELLNAIMHGIGALIAIFIAFMQYRFSWWPFSALGFAVSQYTMMNITWSELFIAWIIKTCVLRYGGVSTYKKLLPVFMGMIVGAVSMSVISALLNLVIQLF